MLKRKVNLFVKHVERIKRFREDYKWKNGGNVNYRNDESSKGERARDTQREAGVTETHTGKKTDAHRDTNKQTHTNTANT